MGERLLLIEKKELELTVVVGVVVCVVMPSL